MSALRRFGIIIIGFKNAEGISRLLKSLDFCDFGSDNDVMLIFSIDYSGDDTVKNIATKYQWNHGEKIVNAYNTNLGLQSHIFSCGDYLEKYNLDAAAVLEDDIFVAPEMYGYMKAAVAYYENDPRIAGISLYKHEYNIYAKHPFYDLNDGGDTYFVKYAQSWGQIWMRDKWREFKEWYLNKEYENITSEIPQNVLNWKNSWLKYHIIYCISQNKYFVYPRVSLTTNFTDAGTHNSSSTTQMQVPICMKKKNWEFKSLDETSAIYDGFFENECVKKLFNEKNIVVDLYGVKAIDLVDKSCFLLTRRELPFAQIKSWGMQLRPIELNVFLDIQGNDIFLYDLSKEKNIKHDKLLKRRQFEYDLKGVNIMQIQAVKYSIDFIKKYIKLKWKGLKKRFK